MARGQFLSSCATLACFYLLAETVFAQNRHVQIPRTRFTCTGRASGYYADVETGCQVYHMCDGLGRQFSYTCPNTTLFQQRMLICDHWYMVNCSMSERDYDANLLIGQRDKPFVSDEEMHLRTPRPDILSVPLNNNYYDGLKEAESKFPVHPGNSIVGIADSISSANNNGLDSAKNNYRPPTSWSTGTNVNRPSAGSNNNEDQDSLTGAASLKPNPTFRPSPTFQPLTGDGFIPTNPTFVPSTNFQPSPEDDFKPTQNRPTVTAPAQDLVPPPQPTTTEASSEEFSIDARMREDPVFEFIKRFDPNSPDSHKTAMTKNEILNLNQHLPDGQSSAEEERTPRRNKNIGNNNINFLQTEKKGNVESSRFDTVNLKPIPTEATLATDSVFVMPTPSRELLPPKTNYSEQPSTTMGPPVYYEWKWAAPAFDLEPPKESNVTANSTQQEKRNITGRSPFRDVRRPTPADIEPTPPSKNTEYNISSYFVPDYLFPLEKGHPGYEDENAETSFQVKVSRPGRASFGENPNCPQCHPAYLNPGTCEPCIVRR